MAIFHRDSTPSSSSATQSIDDPNQSRNSAGRLFGHRSTQSSVSSGSRSSTGNTHRHSIIRRHPEDPSIQAAREQVSRAEAAEREADKALTESRRAVKQARDHVKHLEKEAAEE